VSLPSTHPLVDGRTTHSALVAAYSGGRPARRPVWFMRQAGRSLPEYRAARAGTAMLDACLTPELASELTLQPVRRHDVDAGIFFSDIVVPLRLAGVDVVIEPGVGPVLGSAVRTADDVARLQDAGPLTAEALAPMRRSRSRPTSSRAARRATTSPHAPSCTPTPTRGSRSWRGRPT
jgi:uroporphyrinogen decarboxylase